MANIPGSNWKETKVTYDGTGITTGSNVRSWLNNNMPTCTVCVAVLENAAKGNAEVNNTFVMGIKASGTNFITAIGCRYRDNAFGYTRFESTYDVVLSTGDVVTFLYLE